MILIVLDVELQPNADLVVNAPVEVTLSATPSPVSDVMDHAPETVDKTAGVL